MKVIQVFLKKDKADKRYRQTYETNEIAKFKYMKEKIKSQKNCC